MAFPFGKEGHKDICAGYLFAASRLDVDNGALKDSLEPGCRLGIAVIVVHNEAREFDIDMLDKVGAKLLKINVAGMKNGHGVGVVKQGEQKVLKRCILMPTLVGQGEGMMERSFEIF